MCILIRKVARLGRRKTQYKEENMANAKAIQWTGGNLSKIFDFIGEGRIVTIGAPPLKKDAPLVIELLYGGILEVDRNGWIVKYGDGAYREFGHNAFFEEFQDRSMIFDQASKEFTILPEFYERMRSLAEKIKDLKAMEEDAS